MCHNLMILGPTCLVTGNDAENLPALFSRVSAGLGFLGSLMVKNVPANAGDTGWIREQGEPETVFNENKDYVRSLTSLLRGGSPILGRC